MLRDVPIIGRVTPEPSTAQLRALESLTVEIQRERPELAADSQFHSLVPESLTNGACLHLDDLSEISCLDGGQEFLFMQDRARLRAGDGDIVATLSPEVAGYEHYCQRQLGLGRPQWLHPALGKDALQVAQACWMDRHARSTLVHLLRTDSLHYLHPHMGTFGVWELGVLLHEHSRRPVKIIAPPPALAALVNNKIAFARIVARLFGGGFVPATVSAWNMATLCQQVSKIAKSARMIGLKRPHSAGGDGIAVLEARPICQASLHEIHNLLGNLVNELQWDRNSEMLISCWEQDVLCSPSVQLWIPTKADGAPIVEGVFKQFLDRDTGVFVGAVEAELPSDLLSDISTRSWLLARLFQKLGYVGRCSFDTMLVGESLERSRLEFIECNGRWGGTSLPMSLMNRLFGESTAKPYAVRTLKVDGLKRISFSRLCELLNLAIYDRRTGRGRLVFTTPGLMHHQSAITVLAIGHSAQDATKYAENSVPALLRQVVESDTRTVGSDGNRLAGSP